MNNIYTCYMCKNKFETNIFFKDMNPICDNCLNKIPDNCRINNYKFEKYKRENKNKPCPRCGWNESYLDLHHIIPRSVGGGDNKDNFVCLCPNCHRLAHRVIIIITPITKNIINVSQDIIKNRKLNNELLSDKHKKDNDLLL